MLDVPYDANFDGGRFDKLAMVLGKLTSQVLTNCILTGKQLLKREFYNCKF